MPTPVPTDTVDELIQPGLQEPPRVRAWLLLLAVGLGSMVLGITPYLLNWPGMRPNATGSIPPGMMTVWVIGCIFLLIPTFFLGRELQQDRQGKAAALGAQLLALLAIVGFGATAHLPFAIYHALVDHTGVDFRWLGRVLGYWFCGVPGLYAVWMWWRGRSVCPPAVPPAKQSAQDAWNDDDDDDADLTDEGESDELIFGQ